MEGADNKAARNARLLQEVHTFLASCHQVREGGGLGTLWREVPVNSCRGGEGWRRGEGDVSCHYTLPPGDSSLKGDARMLRNRMGMNDVEVGRDGRHKLHTFPASCNQVREGG